MEDGSWVDDFRKLKVPGYYRLLPRHRIYLFAPEPSTKEEAERFARLFVETWKRIPLRVRREMLWYWKEPERRAGIRMRPQIELLPDWSGHELRRGRRGLNGTKASTSMVGYELRFWTKIVAVYPDELVRALIAHELAHVCQAAEGKLRTLAKISVTIKGEENNSSLHGTNRGLVVVFPISLTITCLLVSGRPRQFCVM